MKIDKYEKLTKGKYRLYLDNGEVIDTYDEVILQNNLLLKKELDPSTYNQIQIESAIQENYNACIKYITIRVRSQKEIEEYLKRKKINYNDISLIISKLLQNNFLNDDYFTQCFINDKFKFTSWGPYRIKNELKKHNIDNEIINKHLNYLTNDQISEKLTKLINKHIASNHKLDKSHLKHKLYNNFLNLGYNSNMIITILNEKL